MTVRLSYNLPGSLLITDFAINFLINLTLNRKGLSLVHGSAIGKSGKFFVFSAQGGAGKTANAMKAIENNYQYLGDDSVILHESRVYNYIKPLNIFPFNYFPLFREKIPFLKRLEFAFKNLLRITGINLVTKVDPRQIIPNSIGTYGPLKKCFVLIPKTKWDIEPVTKEQAIPFIVNNQKLDSIPYSKYIQMYGFTFPESDIAHYWEIYEENLEKNLVDALTGCYLVHVPLKYDDGVFTNLMREVGDGR
jgi:hypothetical protein